MKMRRIAALVLAATVVFAWTAPAAAAESAAAVQEHNAVVEARAAELEEKYNIRITYEMDADNGAVIDRATLNTMDIALSSVTAPVVRQVSAHYQKTIGRRLTFSYVYTPFSSEDYGVEIVGDFDESIARIRLYIPQNSIGTYTTGAAPLTIVHEFAHALHRMCDESLGRDTISAEWRALNGDASYNYGYLSIFYKTTTFMSSYGATSYREDFAEVFSHAFVRNKAGQGVAGRLTRDGSYTSLGRKVQYIEQLLPRVMTDTAGAVANLHRIFTTPEELNYQGVTLSGDDLQFMGCAQPRYVLRGIMRAYGIQAQSSEWIREVGGWYVHTTGGNHYLLFPGGNYVELRAGLRTAA